MTTQTPASNSDARKRLEERKRMAASLGTVASNEGPRQSSSHAEPKYQELLKRRTEAAEYTPTTDEVRDNYVDHELNHLPAGIGVGLVPVKQAEFDRWLAAHDTEVAAKAKAEQREVDLAMHRAYRPEVVAEVAVYLGEDVDWDEVAAWCGGKAINLGPDPSGEYGAAIQMPDGEVAVERMWIVHRHDGSFDVRAEVEGPSEQSIETIRAKAKAEERERIAEAIAMADRHDPDEDGDGPCAVCSAYDYAAQIARKDQP